MLLYTRLWVSNWIPLGFVLDTIWSLWDSMWMMSEFFGVRAGLNVDHLGFDMDFCGVRFGFSFCCLGFVLGLSTLCLGIALELLWNASSIIWELVCGSCEFCSGIHCIVKNDSEVCI